MSTNATPTMNKYGTPIILTIGGYDVSDSPRFATEEDAIAYIKQNCPACGFRYL